jgi:hypothetical protein
MVGPTAAVDAQGSNCDPPLAQPVAYVTRPEVIVVHVVFECCIGRSRDGQLQDTCALVCTGGLGGAVTKVPQGRQSFALWKGGGVDAVVQNS